MFKRIHSIAPVDKFIQLWNTIFWDIIRGFCPSSDGFTPHDWLCVIWLGTLKNGE